MARSILHLDLDAFFAAVEQRDKPSLRGKPVVVGGSGPRGVVATASYEAREFGVRSAMPGGEARRRCPHAAFLGGRFQAYRESSQVVMNLLQELSPTIEPLSFDEAFVDLSHHDLSETALLRLVRELRQELTERTAGLTASVGVGNSKLIAKLASEAAKPDGLRLIEPGTETDFIAPMRVRALPGVGPVTEAKLLSLDYETVAQLRRAPKAELMRELGEAAGESVYAMARAWDEREVASDRETKSISTEDTFASDITDPLELSARLKRDAADVARRVQAAKAFVRSVTLKVRFGDFSTITRSRSLGGATDAGEQINQVAQQLLAEVDVRPGVRLLGVGVSGFSPAAQEQLFSTETEPTEIEPQANSGLTTSGVRGSGFYAGADVNHDEFGRGWVWGTGLGRVTVRFETRTSSPGPVRTFQADDPALATVDPEPLPGFS